MEVCAIGEIQGYVAFHSLPNIWFILRKKPDNIRREILKQVCDLLSVVGVGHDKVVRAIEADYKYADTKVIVPSEFCKLLGM